MGAAILGAALRSLRRNRLRSALSILSVSIGIAAVIATASLGGGSTARIDQQITSLGNNFLWIRDGNRNVGGVRTGSGGRHKLTIADAAALANESPVITMCSPRTSGREQLIVGDQNWNTTYRGVSADFFAIRSRGLVSGSTFTPADEANAARVLVLGQAVSQELFGSQNPIGREVRMGAFPFRVIGLLESKGTDTAGLDRDDAVFLPISTAMRSFDRRPWVDDVMCSVSDASVMDAAEAEATQTLRQRHRLPADAPDDFQIRKPVEFLQSRAETASTLQTLLVAIGSVSLLIGGIGIMNIMLVSVTERRQEIGVRMAIGARARDIRRQFLCEAAAIGLAGGLAGILLGLGISWGFAVHLDSPMVVSAELVGWVACVAIAAGVFFGYLPARRASALDPIEAIKTET